MNREYEELKKIWYNKLKEGGFKDIEQENGMLDNRANAVMKAKSQLYSTLKNEYYAYFSAISYFYYNYKKLPLVFRKYDRIMEEYIQTGNLLKSVKNNYKYYESSIRTINVNLTRALKNNLDKILKFYNEAAE